MYLQRAEIWLVLLALALNLAKTVNASPLGKPSRETGRCRKTKVAILGAGMAGITAARSLVDNNVTDFLIVESRDTVGGRARNAAFGSDPKTGMPYQVELGANWVETARRNPQEENPVAALAKKFRLRTALTDFDSINTFDENGPEDYSDLIEQWESASKDVLDTANVIKLHGLIDLPVRTGYNNAGWRPGKSAKAQAVDWWMFDAEYISSPEGSSLLYNLVNSNASTENSDGQLFSVDGRGINTLIKGQASTFLNCTADFDCRDDTRLLLNTIVTNIAYSNTSVTVTSKDGSCIEADYAICTFSLGVLQQSAAPTQNGDGILDFQPGLPAWKRDAIQAFPMGTYTKIFLQFPSDKMFWDKDKQFSLYADPYRRGYYPSFQSLDNAAFYPGSGLLIATVVGDQSYVVEAQSEQTTKQQILAVLRAMYGANKVPEPTAFMYPRWSKEQWAYGSFSTWPTGATLQQHQNLKANLGRLYFAGEGTSAQYWGYLHGAWYEGDAVGKAVAKCIADKKSCKDFARYEIIIGPTSADDFNEANGYF